LILFLIFQASTFTVFLLVFFISSCAVAATEIKNKDRNKIV